MYIVTGGAGYIGGHLVDRLIEEGNQVVVIDDFSSGNYINPKARLVRQDLRLADPLNFKEYRSAVIYHLAANPNVRESMINVYEHFERDVRVTLNVLELARKIDASKLIFTSSSTVYGEASIIPTPENSEKRPISNYGLFKLICENMIEYYSRVYGLKSIVIRLANVVGGRMSHGIIVDFIRKLRNNSKKLEILGNGKQRKSYIYISDVIDAFLFLEKKVNERYEEYNLGSEDYITVDEIAKIVEEELGVNPEHEYIDAGEGRGWVGDVRFMLLDISKLKRLGWRPKYSSREAVRKAVRDLIGK